MDAHLDYQPKDDMLLSMKPCPGSLGSMLSSTQRADGMGRQAMHKHVASHAAPTPYFPVAGKHFTQAVDGYSKAIDLNPNNAIYYANRAFAHIKLENYGSAVADATKALEIDPKYIKVGEGLESWVERRTFKARCASAHGYQRGVCLLRAWGSSMVEVVLNEPGQATEMGTTGVLQASYCQGCSSSL